MYFDFSENSFLFDAQKRSVIIYYQSTVNKKGERSKTSISKLSLGSTTNQTSFDGKFKFILVSYLKIRQTEIFEISFQVPNKISIKRAIIVARI